MYYVEEVHSSHKRFSKWWGQLEDGRKISAIYKEGILEIDLYDGKNHETILKRAIGLPNDNFLSYEELRVITCGKIKWPSGG